MNFSIKQKNEILERIKLSKKEEQEIKTKIEDFIKKVQSKSKKFIIIPGGSFAKKTLIRRRVCDVDLFTVFKRSQDFIVLEQVLKKIKIPFKVLKGSRDYFQIELTPSLVIEMIPILEIKNPDDAENITDISLFHVKYILKKINKKSNLADEIRLAKAFCFAQDCYGAESYISGFSGYALEILVSYYGSFTKFIDNASKWKDKQVIDPEKHYKNEAEILENLNYAKLNSPLILIDPVQKTRNVAAAISKETYINFIDVCKKFKSKPRSEFFFKQELDVKSLEKKAKRKNTTFFVVNAYAFSNKKDIAGAKLKKLYGFLVKTAEKHGFVFIESHFAFDEINLEGKFYFIIKEPGKSYVIRGPPVTAKEANVEEFKKKWKNIFILKGNLYAEGKRETSFKKFLENLDKDQLKDMKIKNVQLEY